MILSMGLNSPITFVVWPKKVYLNGNLFMAVFLDYNFTKEHSGIGISIEQNCQILRTFHSSFKISPNYIG
jgi:hypothetical protein